MAQIIESLVIDAGSGTVKAGFGGDDAPRAVFPGIVKRPRHTGVLVGMGQKEAYVGDEYQVRKRIPMTENCPIQAGFITNWDDMEKIWHHTFYNELRVAPEEHPVMLSEAPNNRNELREKSTQIMFETFNVPALFMAQKPVLSLYGYGRLTGVTVQIGHQQCVSVPVYEGSAIDYSVESGSISGERIIDKAVELINKIDPTFITTRTEQELARDIKEKYCYISVDPEIENSNEFTDIKNYEMWDGRIVPLARVRYQAPEILFNPSLIESHEKGIHEIVFDSIMKTPFSLRNELVSEICLAGGSTKFPGFPERLTKNLQSLEQWHSKPLFIERLRKERPLTNLLGRLPSELTNQIFDLGFKNLKIRACAPYERKYISWIGGSILASLETTKWFCKEDYDELGPTGIHFAIF